MCVLWRAWCWHRNCLQEVAVPGGDLLADAFLSLPVCCEEGRHVHKHTCMHRHTLTQGWSGAGRSHGELSNEMRESKGGRHGGKEGGGSSAESSTFPQSGDLTHGSHTFLSPAADRAPALRERREREGDGKRERKLSPLSLTNNTVMEGKESLFTCGTCVCFHMCLPKAPVFKA